MEMKIGVLAAQITANASTANIASAVLNAVVTVLLVIEEELPSLVLVHLCLNVLSISTLSTTCVPLVNLILDSNPHVRTF
jgi:hypothetical protein